MRLTRHATATEAGGRSAGVLVMTGTGIVPPDDFTLQPGDIVTVNVGALRLRNSVER